MTFGCKELDSKGFVVDFGKLKYIKKYIEDMLDHACVLSWNDPLYEEIIAPGVYKVYSVENASCEGLAKHLFEQFSDLLHMAEGERTWIDEIEIFEDSKNSVKYKPTNDG
jgi:6-pyruvoyltetrahydropterin/6-carboxytetrahydropterin synthase